MWAFCCPCCEDDPLVEVDAKEEEQRIRRQNRWYTPPDGADESPEDDHEPTPYFDDPRNIDLLDLETIKLAYRRGGFGLYLTHFRILIRQPVSDGVEWVSLYYKDIEV